MASKTSVWNNKTVLLLSNLHMIVKWWVCHECDLALGLSGVFIAGSLLIVCSLDLQ